MTRIIKIVTSDGCFYQDEVDANLSNKEIVEKVLNMCYKEVTKIYDENFELIYRKEKES